MASQPLSNLTQVLSTVGQGASGSLSHLFSIVYDELHRMAKGQMALERPGRTLNTTILVHEAYLRLMGNEPVTWQNRGHFFGAAAEAMRRIRVDSARCRLRVKRGAGKTPTPIQDDMVAVLDPDPVKLLAIDEALEKLDSVAPRQARIVKLKYFAGLSVDEIAQAIGISPRSVDLDWQLARTWLHRELGRSDTRFQLDDEN